MVGACFEGTILGYVGDTGKIRENAIAPGLFYSLTAYYLFFWEFPSLVKATTIFPLTQIYTYISTMLLRSSPLHVALTLVLMKVHS